MKSYSLTKDPSTVWICNLHQLAKWLWKMTIDVKTCSIYWCAFSWSNPKFLWQLKQHEIRFKCFHKVSQLFLQITRALASVYKSGWLQVSFRCLALYFLKGICRNGIFCTWARLFVFLANYLPTVTLFIARYIQDLTTC